MILENTYVESSGSLGVVAPKRDKYKTPLDKVLDQLKRQREDGKLIEKKQRIDEILKKEPSFRTLEETLLLAEYYGAKIVDKLPKCEPKFNQIV